MNTDEIIGLTNEIMVLYDIETSIFSEFQRDKVKSALAHMFKKATKLAHADKVKDMNDHGRDSWEKGLNAGYEKGKREIADVTIEKLNNCIKALEVVSQINMIKYSKAIIQAKIIALEDFREEYLGDHSQDEQARTRKGDSVSQDMICYALKSTSNKRDGSSDKNQSGDSHGEKKQESRSDEICTPENCDCDCHIFVGGSGKPCPECKGARA